LYAGQYVQKRFADRHRPGAVDAGLGGGGVGLGVGNFQSTEDMTGFALYLPHDATDGQMQDFVSIIDQSLLPGDTIVKRAEQP
jgi:hypothetical protein